jgi:hypothetical protein
MDDFAGCPQCGWPHIEPIDFKPSDGRLFVRCKRCGVKLVCSNMFPTTSPDKNGNVFSDECRRTLSERLKKRCDQKTSNER